MVNKLKIWLRFLGFPAKDKCLIRKVSKENIYNDMVVANSWFLPDIKEDETTLKNHMVSLSFWNIFISSIQTNDELWYYRFPEKMWRKLKGSHGYVILRNGKYYDYFELARN